MPREELRIYRIAANAAIDRMRTASFRQLSRESPLEDLDRIVGMGRCAGTQAGSLERQLIEKERRRCFWSFIMRFRPNFSGILSRFQPLIPCLPVLYLSVTVCIL
jgi:hypothetical protein